MSNLNVNGLLEVLGDVLQNGQLTLTTVTPPNGTSIKSGYENGTQGGVNFSNGLKIRWGRTPNVTTGSGGTATTFLDPFEIGATGVATLQARTGFAIQTTSKTEIRFRADSAGYVALWIAIGY